MKMCFINILILTGEDFTNDEELNLIIEKNLNSIAPCLSRPGLLIKKGNEGYQSSHLA